MKHAAVVTLLLAAAPAVASAESPALETAYLKELAFLKAEKATLERRAQEVNASGEARIAASESEIDRLEARLLGLRRQADLVEERLRDAERNQEQSDKAGLAFETLSRAREPLAAAGHSIEALPADEAPAPEVTARVIGETFAATEKLLRSADDVAREQGEFFLEDGTLVKGDIVRVGRVAAFGVSSKGAGALAPAGGGKLRIWPAPAAETAVALEKGRRADVLRIFLFEQTEKAITAKKEKSLLTEVALGGPIAVVIVGLGLLALLMILYRAAVILIVDAQTKSLVGRVLPLVRAGHTQKALRLAEASKSAAGRVLQATLRNLGTERSKLDDVIAEAMLDETPAIERFGTAITVFAAIAPLLGLLGTVTGMIATFDVITEFGTGDPRMLSGGISEALITTKLGLVVAIPSLLLGTLLSGRADSLITKIEHAALKMVNADDGLDTGPPEQPSAPPEPAGLPVAEPAP